jgi:hypothetical protein
MTMRQIIETGGWLMYVLGAMSVAGLALVIYFLVRAAPRAGAAAPVSGAGARQIAKAAWWRLPMPAAPIPPPWLPSWARPWSMPAQQQAGPRPAAEIVEGEGGRQATIIQNQTSTCSISRSSPPWSACWAR